ncbi:hypothetical protein OG439_47640 [Amycolatopsis sp. NBC_01307]|uniref:hypothetical protein n=1 Tax=Amycolatopsis sp. NBC_01307 TaxID=2903561 RepID=UPI002E13894A|nr:hypothetical protein OG439_47640 [Amycolatopsis sp. NBC_01307]
MNAELSDVEQLVQELPRCLRQVHGEVGKRIEPAEVGHDRRRFLVGCVQFCDGGQCNLLLALEVVVAFAEPSGEGVARVAFAGLPHDRVLLAGDRGKQLLPTGSLGFSFKDRMIIDAALLNFEDRSPFGAEEPVGVEPADGFQEFVFTQADRRGQAGMQVWCGPVVLAGPAEVVGHTRGLRVAGHATTAAVDDSSAKDVLAFGLGMVVERVIVT